MLLAAQSKYIQQIPAPQNILPDKFPSNSLQPNSKIILYTDQPHSYHQHLIVTTDQNSSSPNFPYSSQPPSYKTAPPPSLFDHLLYHFSPPSTSRKPPSELESLPRRAGTRVKGGDRGGGDADGWRVWWERWPAVVESAVAGEEMGGEAVEDLRWEGCEGDEAGG